MGVGYKSSNGGNDGIELGSLRFAPKRSKNHSTTVFVESVITRQESIPGTIKPDGEGHKPLNIDEVV